MVINLGSRQKGRLLTENIKNIDIENEVIVETAKELSGKPVPSIQHPYGKGNAASTILQHIIKNLKSKEVKN